MQHGLDKNTVIFLKFIELKADVSVLKIDGMICPSNAASKNPLAFSNGKQEADQRGHIDERNRVDDTANKSLGFKIKVLSVRKKKSAKLASANCKQTK